jgi:hypothetical protein
MSTIGFGPRRQALKASLAILAGCFFARPGRSQSTNDEYNQPKLNRELVKYRNAPGPDGHYCGNCTNFITPNHCRVVDGEIVPNGYCLSYAPKDIDFP